MKNSSIEKLKKTNISEFDFFTSKVVYKNIYNLIKYIEREYSLFDGYVKLDYNQYNSDIANTNNFEYYFNAGSEFLKDCVDINEKLNIMYGIVFHELGHRIYTNFFYSNAYIKNFTKGELLPDYPTPKNEKEKENLLLMKKMLKENHDFNKFALSFIFNINNIIEDIRMENLLITNGKKYQILWNGLICSRNYIRNHSTIQKNEYEFKSIELANLIFSLANNINTEIYSNEIKKYIPLIKPIINKMIKTVKAVDYYNLLNEIFFIIFPILIDDIELIKKAANSNSTSNNENSSNTSQSYINNSTLSSSNDSQDDTEASNENSSNTNQNSESNNTNNSTPSNSNDSQDDIKTSNENILNNDVDINNLNKELMDELLNELNSLMETNQIQNVFEEDNLNSNSFGSDDYEDMEVININDLKNNKPTTNNGTFDSLLSKVGNELAEKKADEEYLEKLYLDENKNISKYSYETNYKVIYQIPNEYAEIEYDKIKDKVNELSRKLIRESENILNFEEDYEKGKYFGEKFNTSTICKTDYRNFSKKIEDETPSLEVSLVIDESGSMLGSKYSLAKITMLIIMKFCEKMNIRFSGIGFNTREDTNIYLYTDSRRQTKTDYLRVMNNNCGNCNRDGIGLGYAVDLLKNSNCDNKLCFIISDGQPTSYRSEQHAIEDIQSIVKQAEKNNINVLAIGIDSDKRKISEIYGKDKFVDITKLETLPKKLIKIIKTTLGI